jgi:hypothetical protein
MDRSATLVATARALAEPFPARPERRSALVAPIPRLLADGDMSLSDLPLGDVRSWMVDRRLSHGIAMACRPALPSRCADPGFGVMHRVGRTRGPTTSSPSAVVCREILSTRLPASPSGRAGTGGGMGGMVARRRVAPHRLTAPHPPSSSIVGTCRTPRTGSSPSGRRRVRSRDLTRRRWASGNTCISGGGILHDATQRTCP